MLFWKIVDPKKAALDVADYQSAINWAAQTALRDVIGVDKNLSGELKVETVSKDFEVFITAEQSDGATFPSNVEVLRTQ